MYTPSSRVTNAAVRFCRTTNCQKAFILSLFLFLGSQKASQAFSPANHEIVGRIATERLKQTAAGNRALIRIRAILGNDDLGEAARWADEVKSSDSPDAYSHLSPNSDTAKFLKKVKDYYTAHPSLLKGEAEGQPLKGHRLWHYVNMPFQTDKYQLGKIGTRNDDVVQMINHCVQRLRGINSSESTNDLAIPIELDEKEALRLLAHYAGDIHQPLHVGCGYVLQQNGRFEFVMPSGTGHPRADSGGNSLAFYSSSNLHSFWDGNAPNRLRYNHPLADYAHELVTEVSPTTSWSTYGDVSTWSKQWADDTLIEAKSAYRGIKIVSAETRDDEPDYIKCIITRPYGYKTKTGKIARVQLAKAGYRLADLLTKIWGSET